MQLRLKAVIDQRAESTAECLCDLSAAWVRAVCIGLLLLLVSAPSQAQVIVKTVAGGRLTLEGPDAGFQDGDALQSSQFNTPAACAVDASGNIYIADTGNGALRKLDVAANRCRTLVRGLSQPVAVAVASTNSIFVLTLGDRQLREFDRFGNQVKLISGFFSPVAVATDTDGTLIVAESSGSIVRVNPSATPATVTQILTGVSQPGGVAVLDSGVIAVSESGQNRVRFINPTTRQTVLQVGSEFGTAGFQDGVTNAVRFNQPQHLAKAPNGSIVVADRGNHRVRLIALDGAVTTLYGKNPADWFSDFPGWEDGSAEIAEACQPSGVAVSGNTIFTTELCYHLVRQVTGVDLTTPTTGGGGGGTTNSVVATPRLSIMSGYFPTGVEIQVTSDSGIGGFGPGTKLFFTTDGSEPTTNSTQVPIVADVGRIFFRDTLRDLTALRVKAFSGTNSSSTVAGVFSPRNEVGVPADLEAGIGATIVVPVVANLRPGEMLRSLQFNVEVTPKPGAPAINAPFSTLAMTPNDFVSIRAASTNALNATATNTASSSILPVAYIGTNAVFTVTDFAVVALLALPIPITADVDDEYTISVTRISGTSDGQERPVELVEMASRTVRVKNYAYLVGDSSPGRWYNAKDFGDDRLHNADVNNAFYASLGIKTPFQFSDVFDSMDAFPEDTSVAAGGDGRIRFLDWQVILQRSLGLSQRNFRRTWAPGGVRVPQTVVITSGAAHTAAEVFTMGGPGAVWVREALLGAVPVKGFPGSSVDVPVYLDVAPGSIVSGLGFNATIVGSEGAPPLTQTMTFISAAGMPTPIQGLDPSSQNTLLCGWSVGSFGAGLKRWNLLGHIRVPVPAGATAAHQYRLTFPVADGSPDLSTQYAFETVSALIAIGSDAPAAQAVSDEWKVNFFGNTSVALDADADSDGMSNAAEFAAGTNPIQADSRLAVEVQRRPNGTTALRWLSAPGRSYRIEAAPTLNSTLWSSVGDAVPGTGFVVEPSISTAESGAAFFRVRVER